MGQVENCFHHWARSKNAFSSLSSVFGSDGTSYANFCVFTSTQCEQQNQGNSLYLAGLPKMDGVNGVGECVTSFTTMAEEDCNISCPRPGVGRAKLCGSNGLEYTDRCEFEVARCKAKIGSQELTRVQCP